MRRRRNKSTWFPVLGGIGDLGVLTTIDQRYFTVDRPDTPNVIAIPIIPDATPEVDVTVVQDFSLREFVEGQSAIIDRVVGKVVWTMDQFAPDSEETTTNLAICCTGIAVLPVLDDATGPALPSTDFDPLLANNSAAPWLWRRTWVLANNASASGSSFAGAFYSAPACNEFFASRDDGPHLDTRGTKRAIRREQRLFVIHSARALDSLGDGSNQPGDLTVITDLRVIGRMTRGRNKSTFK